MSLWLVVIFIQSGCIFFDQQIGRDHKEYDKGLEYLYYVLGDQRVDHQRAVRKRPEQQRGEDDAEGVVPFKY